LSVQLEEDPVEGKTANVVVPDDQLSLAIGRAGQNARLAAKLTGWRIDIQGVTEAATWALQRVNEDTDVLPALGPVAELLPTVAGILRQHEQEKMPYSSQELLTMRQVIQAVRGYYTSIRDAERARLLAEEAARQAVIRAAANERRAIIDAALALIPPGAYEIPLGEMGLSKRVLDHLERAELSNAGEVMERLAEGDEGLLKLDGIGPKSLAEVKRCIEALALVPEVPEPAEAQIVAEEEAEIEAGEEVAAEVEVALPVEPVSKEEEPEVTIVEQALAAEEPVAVEEPAPAVVVEEVVAVPEIALEIAEEAPVEEEAAPVLEELVVAEVEQVKEMEAPVTEEVPPTLFFEEEEEEELSLEEARKRERRLRRELVYDEELGEVVARRRRKRGQDADEFDQWDEYLR
jgi:N utilization substance protein A